MIIYIYIGDVILLHDPCAPGLAPAIRLLANGDDATRDLMAWAGPVLSVDDAWDGGCDSALDWSKSIW